MNNSPRVFISYAWTSSEHIEWVIQLASELRSFGVDIVLDKWDLKEGHDAHAFMEQMVTDPAVQKVIMICDEVYASKANARSGGVGTEAQIISPNLYGKRDQSKFVAVVREKDSDGNAHVPAFYSTRIHIDMSDDDLYSANLEQLLRWIFDKPAHPKPPIGKKPSYLDSADNTQIGNSALHRAAFDALKSSKANALMLTEDYLESVVTGLEEIRLLGVNRMEVIENEVLQRIEQFSPTKNELIDIFQQLARSHDISDAHDMIVRFVEQLLRYKIIPDHITQYNDESLDHYRFIVSEIFLCLMTCLIKREKFHFAETILGSKFLFPARHNGPSTLVSFMAFEGNPSSLNTRNRRLQLNRISPQADLLKQRCVGSQIQFRDMMQAEFVLFLRSYVDALKSTKMLRPWYPQTLVYSVDSITSFDIFLRASSQKYFEKLRPLLAVHSVEELRLFVERMTPPRFDWDVAEIPLLSNLDTLGTEP